MTIKRTKHRVGPFDRTSTKWTLVHIDDDENRTNVERPGEMAEIGRTLLEALSPRGRIRRWREHADRLNVAGDLLDAAEALMNEQGTVENMDRFDALMVQAQLEIERAQNEHMNVYGLAGSRAKQSDQLRETAKQRNDEQRRKAAEVNARLIALDDSVANDWPTLSQTQRAKKIIAKHGEKLPESICISKPESLAKRIRDARK